MPTSKFIRKFIIRPAEHLYDLQYASANADPQATAWPSMNVQMYRKSIQKRPGYSLDRSMVSGDKVQDCIVYTKYDNKSYSLILTDANLIKREPTETDGGTWSYLTETYTGGTTGRATTNGTTAVEFTDTSLIANGVVAKGDKFILDLVADHAVDKEPATGSKWSNIESVTDADTLVLTAVYGGSSATDKYKIRKVYTTPDGERWTWTVVNDKFCFTNGNTDVQYWNGAGYAGALNAVNACQARYCLNYANRLFLADLYFPDEVGGTYTRHPWTVRWSAEGKPETYLLDGDTTAGESDFLGTDDVITGLGQTGQQIVVYKYNSLIFGNRTGVATSPVEFPTERRGLGCIAPYSIIPVAGTNVFLGNDNFYSLNGDVPEQFGDKIRDKFFDVVSETDRKRMWGKLLVGQRKILWIANSNSGEGQLAFVYDYGNREWATWKFYQDVTGIGECA